MTHIPINRATLAGKELEYVLQAIENMHISGDGPFTQRCQTLLEQTLGVPKALLTTSCTHALEMAALLLRLKPGDEVIVPSYTFVSTAGAFTLHGATPVFADIRRDTLNLDETVLESLITQRTRAIVPVHYAGVACEMDTIGEIARSRGATVVEDNAHGLFGTYKGRSLGSLGAMAAQSFHETKNFTCGEGGALLLNDGELIERAEIIREKGTNRSRFFRGQVDKYTWVDSGSSYPMSDLLAGFLLAQLERRETIQEKRRAAWHYYQEGLSEWAENHGVRLPFVPDHCGQTHHMFYIILPSQEIRQAMIDHLSKSGIAAVFHYVPLHLSDEGRRLAAREHHCPVSEWVSDRLLRLPFYTAITPAEQQRTIDSLMAFDGFKRRSSIAGTG